MRKGVCLKNSTVFLLILFIGFWAVSSHAFERIQLKNQREYYQLGSSLSYLQDSQAKWSIENIQSPLFSGQWQRNKTEIPAFGFTSSVYWFAIELQNPDAIPVERILALTYPLLDSVNVYLEHNGKIIERFHAGDHELFSQRLIKHRHFLFPIHIPKNEWITLYLRVQTSSTMQLPLALWSERSFWMSDQGSIIVQGAYFGIMLVMILYNLFIYTAVRDRSYLYYVLFVSCFTLLQFSLHGFAYRYLWPQHPWFNEKILIISVCATLTFGGLFTASLLELKKQINTFYRVIILTTLFAPINAIASLFLNYTTAIAISLGNSFVMSSFSLVAGCIMWKRAYAPARFYTIAWIGFLTGTIVFVLSKIGVVPRTLLTENGIQLGSVIEVLLLSFALANRINVTRREKQLAQAEKVSILKQYQGLYENAIEGIFQTTLESNFVSANRATIQMFGLPNKEILLSDDGRNLRDCFANQTEADEFCQMLLERGKIIGHEFRAQHTDDSEFWASISTRTVYDDSGKPIHYEGSFINITEKREAEEQVRYMAYYDNVTGLPNRALLQDLLTHALNRAKRNDERVAVLFIDLNRFKLVNDTLGHNAGDRLLQEVAERLNDCLRGGDWIGRPQSSVVDVEAGETSVNTVARLGGDEFVMVMTDIRHAEDAAILARRVGMALEQSFTLDGQEVYISASIGISSYPIDSDNPVELLKQADAAMYHIKKQGINDYQFYTDYLSTHASKRLVLETELRNALSNNEFQVYYQAKLDLKSGQIVGAEALCRWQHPERGLILPTEFIGLAEEIGLIVPLGEWVLLTACKQNKDWQDVGIPPIRMSVNLSVRQFAEPQLLQVIRHALDRSGLHPEHLELELTESILMDDAQATGKVLDQLKGIGLHISVDDFGTGYSSLSYLKRLPVDILKIDRCFIQDITRDADNQAITTAIISMARQLGLKVIAEGVETEEQLHYLQEHKCDEIQGYIVSTPLAGEQFYRLLSRNDLSSLV